MTYTHEVRFTKVFTGGTLAGLRIQGEAVRFCDAASACAFVKKALSCQHVRKPCGGSPYRIEDPYIYSLEF